VHADRSEGNYRLAAASSYSLSYAADRTRSLRRLRRHLSRSLRRRTGDSVLGTRGGLRIQLPDLDAQGFLYDPLLHPANRDNFILNTQIGSLLLTGFREEGSNVAYLRTRVTVFARTPDASGAPARLAAPSVGDPLALKRAIQWAARERETLLPQ
jgi:hypothetical protein